jgi:nicotinamide mononucleotide adenylyltransferase
MSTTGADTMKVFPLKAAVTVQEIAPGDFRYWIVHLEYVENDGENVTHAEASTKPYASAEDAWAAGVQECRRIIETPESDKERKHREDVRRDVAAAVERLEAKTKK